MKYEQFTKRTEDPKLAYIERLLDERGIAHRRKGFSWHAPILQVEATRIDDAWALLSQTINGVPLDDITDDDPMFRR